MLKNFENLSIFVEDMGKSIEVPFLTYSVYIYSSSYYRSFVRVLI
jgi:hypothetical protein